MHDTTDQKRVLHEIGYAEQIIKIQMDFINAFLTKNFKSPEELSRPDFRLGYKVDEIDKMHADICTKQNELCGLGDHIKALDSYAQFECLFGIGIYRLDSLCVEVIEAKALRPSAAGRYEDVYCKLHLHNNSKHVENIFRPDIRYTSFCEKTLDPVWYEERFVFDTARNDTNGTNKSKNDYILHITVKGRGLLSDSTLGETSIKLSHFDNPTDVFGRDGWFSLQLRQVSTLNELADPLTAGQIAAAAGSIRLRVRWVHSESRLHESLTANMRG